jgi:hypothetical protein
MRRAIALGAVMILAAAAQSWAVDAKIDSRPLSGQEITDNGLAEGTQVSGGLMTVGVGSAAYLEVLIPAGIEITGAVTWGLSGPGSAALVDDPLGDMPIYSAGEQTLYQLADRMALYPDAEGKYVVTADIPVNLEVEDDDGNVTIEASVISLEETVTAAMYVGVGTMAGASPSYPQCAMCHEEQAAGWAETGHADFFTLAIDGLKSSHYGEGCISCHNVGFDPAPAAVNGGFDDVAAATGWEFPMAEVDGEMVAHPVAGTWEAMPAELQAVSNIQCESCHGPGSQHGGAVGANQIDISYDSGNCGQCHDAMTHHIKNAEWSNSLHAATAVDRGSTSCNVCHSGIGFIEAANGVSADDMNVDYAPIGCATCHDPHDAANPHQVRKTEPVELGNGEIITEGGTGLLCMNCHKSRRNAPEYVAGASPSSHFGPHHGPQADMLAATNGIEYGIDIASTSHLYAAENSCATCHLQEVAVALEDGEPNPVFAQAGGHTFLPSWDGGTPDDHSDDVDLTEACADCHGPMESFDIPRQDYDGDGRVKGVQTEVASLMHTLAMALPPLGEAEVVTDDTYDEAMFGAAYNYEFVREDGSMGIHNPKYAVGLLKASIKDITGEDIVTAVETERTDALPGAFGLRQNYPNPFNPETEISYMVEEPGDVRLSIFNSVGQQIRVLVEAYHASGEYKVSWNGLDESGQKVTAGVYLYSMEAGTFKDTRKMVLLP